MKQTRIQITRSRTQTRDHTEDRQMVLVPIDSDLARARRVRDRNARRAS